MLCGDRDTALTCVGWAVYYASADAVMWKGCAQANPRAAGQVTVLLQMSMQAYYDPPGVRTASGCGDVCLAMVERGIAGRSGAARPGPGGFGSESGAWDIAASVHEAGHDITALVCVQVVRRCAARAWPGGVSRSCHADAAWQSPQRAHSVAACPADSGPELYHMAVLFGIPD